MTTLLDRYRFFRANAGSIVGESALSAWRYAHAERKAESLGLTCVMQDEQEPWDGDCPAPKFVLWCAVFKDSDIDHHGQSYRKSTWIASVGMVGVNSMRDPYLRVVAAELYVEALDVLDQEHQAEADELASRATYAAVAV